MWLVCRCLRCGHVHPGTTPPERCPDCGAPAEEFEVVEED
ncbi:MAG TPA: hypothetical protein VLD61_05965 [Methylomirabilota bacterium]|nr:hypothetical protein [Methylomirabilota bacterium]